MKPSYRNIHKEELRKARAHLKAIFKCGEVKRKASFWARSSEATQVIGA
jgi:hypothetical protein